jgi:hypothetical protein
MIITVHQALDFEQYGVFRFGLVEDDNLPKE